MIGTSRTAVEAATLSAAPAVEWHILTGEYPPQPGGVSDYTRLVARGLARAGDGVTVWAPSCDASDEDCPGVTVRRLPDRFGPRSLLALGRAFDRSPAPKRWLVQYVPHAFGWKAANLPFCWWLRSRRRDSLWVMFHEVAYPWGAGYSMAEQALGFITRRMAATVAGAAERVFVSIPAWGTLVERLVRPRAPIVWLPVASSVPLADDPAGAAEVRSRIGNGQAIVGHLGSYGRLIRPMLAACVPDLLARTNCRLLLLGRSGESMRDEFLRRQPELAGRIHAPGPLTEGALSRHVTACDVLLQPYPDGVSSRRTSVMAALSHGTPVVTTSGRLTEPLWAAGGAVVLTPAERIDTLAAATASLLADPRRLEQLSTRSRALYAERFDLGHIVDRLRSRSDG